MYNNIKLEKGLYSITGKTFTQALAELDPDARVQILTGWRNSSFPLSRQCFFLST